MFKKEYGTIVQNKKQGKNSLQSMSVIAPEKHNIEEAIKCPADSDVNDFIGYNLCQFLEDIEAFVNFIKPECEHKESCKSMNAGENFHYQWQDGKQKPYTVSAVEYCQKLLEWSMQQLADPSIFPEEEGGQYPKDFIKMVKPIFRRLFRVYMHIAHNHMDLIKKNGIEEKYFHCVKLYVEFTKKYKLCDDDDFAPIANMLKNMK